jgi:hypothetical protein
MNEKLNFVTLFVGVIPNNYYEENNGCRNVPFEPSQTKPISGPCCRKRLSATTTSRREVLMSHFVAVC